MPPFEEEGVYYFGNVGWSVGLSVCWSVGRHMVSANYLENLLSQSFHIPHVHDK